MKTPDNLSLLLIALCLTPPAVVAELNITAFTPNGTLTWTNSDTNANYRVEAATSLAGPWVPMTNLSLIQGPNQQVSVQVPTPLVQPVWLYRVVWTDAPSAQPLGTWVYQGFDPASALVVTGLVSITASNPISGTCVFQSATSDLYPKHPVGTAFFNGQLERPNKLIIPFPGTTFMRDNVSLSGQMVRDEFWGYWSYTEYWVNIAGPGGSFVMSGRFSARRQN
ncbi:MAG TPA: hypothetical protein VL361_25655 [Candidatus Limnocylindrales bacterium]|nr:hypothetical protein [Candidatus Limnocylindrales bacterium]